MVIDTGAQNVRVPSGRWEVVGGVSTQMDTFGLCGYVRSAASPGPCRHSGAEFLSQGATAEE